MFSCRRCGHLNPDGSRVCGGCGEPLDLGGRPSPDPGAEGLLDLESGDPRGPGAEELLAPGEEALLDLDGEALRDRLDPGAEGLRGPGAESLRNPVAEVSLDLDADTPRGPLAGLALDPVAEDALDPLTEAPRGPGTGAPPVSGAMGKAMIALAALASASVIGAFFLEWLRIPALEAFGVGGLSVVGMADALLGLPAAYSGGMGNAYLIAVTVVAMQFTIPVFNLVFLAVAASGSRKAPGHGLNAAVTGGVASLAFILVKGFAESRLEGLSGGWMPRGMDTGAVLTLGYAPWYILAASGALGLLCLAASPPGHGGPAPRP